MSSEEVRSVLGRYAPADDLEPVTVVLSNFPLQLFDQARQHHDDLMREFALIALNPPKDRPGHAAPARLLELVELLGKRYGAAAERTDAVRDAAIERGETAMDLTYTVPRSAGPVIRQLRALMREANEFCEREQLLTLATTPLQRRFGDWFYEQFLDQIDGRPARPWDGPMVDREG
jgi:hypothetical protein